MLDKIGMDIGRTTRWGMLQELGRMGIEITTGTKALEITSDGVLVKKGNAVEEIPADTVVLAIGALPYNPLEKHLKQKGIPSQVIGDAIHQGFEAGRDV
jgi:2,4-dienoyl-CoA reductase (NADPH2)